MVLGLVLTGICAGFISAFFGVGGGVVIVPALYHFFPKLGHQMVIASSLAIIFVNCFLNLYNFRKLKRTPNFKAILFIGTHTLVGAIGASFLIELLDRKAIKAIFTAFLVYVIAKLIFQKTNTQSSDESNWRLELDSRTKLYSTIVGLSSGLISGLTGLGGGAILVPMFLTLFGMPMRWVPIYSNGCMIFATGSGVVIHLLKGSALSSDLPQWLKVSTIGNVSFAIVGLVFVGALISSKLGVKVNDRVEPKVKKWLYGLLLTLVGVKIWL